MNIRYIVLPNFVVSANDGDRHFITGRDLIQLYGVDPRECVIENIGYETRGLHGEFTVLEPQQHARDYRLELCRRVVL